MEVCAQNQSQTWSRKSQSKIDLLIQRSTRNARVLHENGNRDEKSFEHISS